MFEHGRFEKLAHQCVKGSVDFTVDDIKAIMLKKGASSSLVPLDQWPNCKGKVVAAYNKFIQTVSAQPLAIEGTPNN